MRFDLYQCDPADLDDGGDGPHTLCHRGLDAVSLLPILCVALYKGAGCQIVASRNTQSDPSMNQPAPTPEPLAVLLLLDKMEIFALLELLSLGAAMDDHPALRDYTEIVGPLYIRVSDLVDLHYPIAEPPR